MCLDLGHLLFALSISSLETCKNLMLLVKILLILVIVAQVSSSPWERICGTRLRNRITALCGEYKPNLKRSENIFSDAWAGQSISALRRLAASKGATTAFCWSRNIWMNHLSFFFLDRRWTLCSPLVTIVFWGSYNVTAFFARGSRQLIFLLYNLDQLRQGKQLFLKDNGS